MKVLIVYETIPEATTVVIADISKEEFDFLNQTNGYTVNLSDYDEDRVSANMAISFGLVERTEDNLKDAEEYSLSDYVGKFVENIVTFEEGAELVTDGVERAIFAGFYL